MTSSQCYSRRVNAELQVYYISVTISAIGLEVGSLLSHGALRPSLDEGIFRESRQVGERQRYGRLTCGPSCSLHPLLKKCRTGNCSPVLHGEGAVRLWNTRVLSVKCHSRKWLAGGSPWLPIDNRA